MKFFQRSSSGAIHCAPTISAVIITSNEESNIAECLSGLKFCAEIVVVDSGSADHTVEIAETLAAKVFFNPFIDFASQKNFGITKTKGDWVLLIDADERVSPELATEVQSVISNSTLDGYYLLRTNQIFGRWMRHGDNAKDLQLRLIRREKAQFKGLVHERIYLEGKREVLKNLLAHYSTKNISSYMMKLNRYTILEAQQQIELGTMPKLSPIKSPTLFLYRYIWQRGFLDGVEGFFFCLLSAYYEFLIQAKCWELNLKGAGN